jgi:hypothetical protein
LHQHRFIQVEADWSGNQDGLACGTLLLGRNDSRRNGSFYLPKPMYPNMKRTMTIAPTHQMRLFIVCSSDCVAPQSRRPTC